MKKRLLLIAIVAILLPMSMMAQTKVIDSESGLEYLDDGDGKLYIDANSNSFFADQDLRPFWRRAFNGNAQKFYKEDLDTVTVIGLSHTWSGGTASAPNGNASRVMNFKGIEYFRNLKSLTIRAGQAQRVVLDLSKNDSLTSLTFSVQTIKLTNLDISNTKLTSLTIPAGYANGFTVKATNSTSLTSLDLSASNVTELDVSNSTNLKSITWPSTTTKLARLDLRGCTGLATTYTSLDPLVLTSYMNLGRFSVKVSGSGLVIGESESVRVSENTDATSLDIDAEGEDVDLSAYTELVMLTCANAKTLDLSQNTKLVTLRIWGTENTNLILSKDNIALTTLDVSKSGMKRLDLYDDEQKICLAPNLEDFKCWFSDLKYLDLSYHERLTYNNNFNSTKLKIIPPVATDKANEYPTGDQIPPSDDGVARYHAKDSLRVIKLRGCRGLSGGLDKPFKLTQDNINGNPVIMSALEEVDLSDCDGIQRFECINSLLKNLKLSGCTNLKVISMNQGMLTGNGDINIDGCTNLTGLIAHRHQWETLDWLLGRPDSLISKLTQIQVNGGSYTMYGYSGDLSTRYVREIYNEATGEMKPLKYTCRLRSLDLSNVSKTGFKKLLCEDNLLKELKLGDAASTIRVLQCRNNLLTTLDLSGLNNSSLWDPDATEAEKWNSRWSPQVGFVPVEIVEGGDALIEGNDTIKGGHDWIALHMDNGGYSHKLDNDVGLYENVFDAMKKDTTRQIGVKDHPYMMTVQEAMNHPAFADDFLCPTGHTGQHIFLHSQTDIYNDAPVGYKDQDLYGRVLTYKYNTGYNRTKVVNPISGETDLPGEVINSEYESHYDPHIEVRMHIWPHILNVNPATKNAESMKVGINFYSSTLCLDYDAVIPKGVEVYFVDSLKSPKAISTSLRGYSSRLDVCDSTQFVMTKFGGEGDILPAYTPVFVKSASKAGLFDFQDAREFVILGWENLRGSNDDQDHILHGVDNNAVRDFKPGLKEKYDAAIAKRKNMMKVDTLDLDLDGNGIIEEAKGEKGRVVKRGNILTGVYGARYNTTNINDSLYNKWAIKGDTVNPRTVLTLGRQNYINNTKIIGFWPYNGTILARNRCVILEEDYNNEVYFATKRTREQAGGPISSTSTRGGSFFFIDEDFLYGGVNGDKRVDEVDAQLILEVSTGLLKIGDLKTPEAIHVPGGNPNAIEVNAQMVLDYSVTSVKPW